MPYITEDRKGALLGGDYQLGETPKDAGELNFVLTMVVLDYLSERPGVSYQALNDVSGALTECLAEFRRKVVVPYEEVKAFINGNVYEATLRNLTQQLQTMVDDEQRARQG